MRFHHRCSPVCARIGSLRALECFRRPNEARSEGGPSGVGGKPKVHRWWLPQTSEASGASGEPWLARPFLRWPRPFLLPRSGGNWKANGSPDSVKKLVKDLNDGDITSKDPRSCRSLQSPVLRLVTTALWAAAQDVEVVCAPPFVFLSEAQHKHMRLE